MNTIRPPLSLVAVAAALALGGLPLAPARAQVGKNNADSSSQTPSVATATATSLDNEKAAVGAVAQRFYDDYVRNIKRLGKPKALLAWVQARPDVSPQFKTVFKRESDKAARSEMGGWEADPILNAQDFPDDSTMAVKDVQVQGQRATVTMNWRKGMDAPVKVTLMKFPEGWKIHGLGEMMAK